MGFAQEVIIMTDAQVFAAFAREHGLNEERVESARQKGVTMTTLVMLTSTNRSALEVDALLYPAINGEETAEELAAKAIVLSGMPRPFDSRMRGDLLRQPLARPHIERRSAA